MAFFRLVSGFKMFAEAGRRWHQIGVNMARLLQWEKRRDEQGVRLFRAVALGEIQWERGG